MYCRSLVSPHLTMKRKRLSGLKYGWYDDHSNFALAAEIHGGKITPARADPEDLPACEGCSAV